MNTGEIFRGIPRNLVKNAKIEIEAEKIIEINGLRSVKGLLYVKKSIPFFMENFPTDLRVYEQKKQSGYNLILLYKGVAEVGCADSMTANGARLKGLAKAEDWPVYQVGRLKKAVLFNIFDNPLDNRSHHSYKIGAERVWAIIEQSLIK